MRQDPLQIRTLLSEAAGLAGQGRYDEAAGRCLHVLAKLPGQLDVLQLLARIYYAAGERASAQAVLEKIVDTCPDDPDHRYRLACLYLENGALDAAEPMLTGLLADGGTRYPAACGNMGYLMQMRGDLTGAAEWYRRALAFNPGSPVAAYNLGTVLRELGEYDAAAGLFRQVLENDPKHAEAYNMLGVVEQDAGHFDRALGFIDRALQLKPDFPDAHRNKAEILLRRGDFTGGWDEYEWRLRKPGHVIPATSGRPRWSGEDLAGKNILIVREQGIGDELMFARCIPELRAVAGDCYLSCDVRLSRLMRRSFPELTVLEDADVRAQSQQLADSVDIELPIGSLPKATGLGRAGIRPAGGYLRADDARCGHFRRQLDALGNGLKVGISWRGGGDPLARMRRSVPLRQWSRLLSLPDIAFVTLQYGEHSQEIAGFTRSSGVQLHELPGLDIFNDLDGLAACMTQLDLVISVDNATVHLAGSLGVPVWVLLPFVAEWRWAGDATSSAWYESVRLFRQSAGRDWGEVLEDVACMLGNIGHVADPV